MRNVKWIGIIGAALYVLAMLVLNAVPGGGPVDAADFDRFYVADQQMSLAILGLFLAGFAAVALLWFLWQLRVAIGTHLAELGFIAGAIGLAQFTVATGLIVAPSGVQLIGGQPFVGAEIAHSVASAGWAIMLVGGAFALAVAVAAFSRAARRTNSLPGWVATTGYVVAAVQVVAAMFVPHFLVPLWFLVVAAVGVEAGTVVEGEPAGSAKAFPG